MHNGILLKGLRACMLIVGIGIGITTSATAQDITPSKVFQVTEDILHQLERMHDANLSKADFSKTRLELPARLPRHVIQQGLNVRTKIQTLSRINGMEVSKLTPPPVREVTPADVMSVAEEILNELVAFDKTYGLAPFKKQAKLADGKTPTDVYANLLKAETMIIQLGIPGTVPNEVYNTAVSVTKEIQLIRKARGKTDPVDPPSASFGKQPSDAYGLAFYALKGLKKLSKKPEYQIPKGVVLPKPLIKGVTPSDVQQLLLYCLAELSSMKVKVGATEPLVLPEPTAGQTPSTVFDQVGLANRQIQSMQW